MLGLVVCVISEVYGGSWYRPVEVEGLLAGVHREVRIEDLWRVVLRGEGVGGRVYFRVELALYDGVGRLLCRGRSWALVQEVGEWRLDYGVLRGFGVVRIEVEAWDWWRLVEGSGGLLPSGVYRVEYRVVETDASCVWTGLLLAEGEVLFRVEGGYWIELVYPGLGDTVCGALEFVWRVVGGGGVRYEVVVYGGRVGWGELVGVVPVVRSGWVAGEVWLPGDLGVLESYEGWLTYGVRGEDGVYSELVWFYRQVDCGGGGVGVGDSLYLRSLWWQQLPLRDGEVELVVVGDTLYLEWIQSCDEGLAIRVVGGGFRELVRWREGVWWRLVGLVGSEGVLELELEVCGVLYRQRWLLLRGGSGG